MASMMSRSLVLLLRKAALCSLGDVFCMFSWLSTVSRFELASDLPMDSDPKSRRRVAAKQHFKNFAKHKILTKLICNFAKFRKIKSLIFAGSSRNVREIPNQFQEIFAKIIKKNFSITKKLTI